MAAGLGYRLVFSSELTIWAWVCLRRLGLALGIIQLKACLWKASIMQEYSHRIGSGKAVRNSGKVVKGFYTWREHV